MQLHPTLSHPIPSHPIPSPYPNPIPLCPSHPTLSQPHPIQSHPITLSQPTMLHIMTPHNPILSYPIHPILSHLTSPPLHPSRQQQMEKTATGEY